MLIVYLKFVFVDVNSTIHYDVSIYLNKIFGYGFGADIVGNGYQWIYASPNSETELDVLRIRHLMGGYILGRICNYL